MLFALCTAGMPPLLMRRLSPHTSRKIDTKAIDSQQIGGRVWRKNRLRLICDHCLRAVGPVAVSKQWMLVMRWRRAHARAAVFCVPVVISLPALAHAQSFRACCRVSGSALARSNECCSFQSSLCYFECILAQQRDVAVLNRNVSRGTSYLKASQLSIAFPRELFVDNLKVERVKLNDGS